MILLFSKIENNILSQFFICKAWKLYLSYDVAVIQLINNVMTTRVLSLSAETHNVMTSFMPFFVDIMSTLKTIKKLF